LGISFVAFLLFYEETKYIPRHLEGHAPAASSEPIAADATPDSPSKMAKDPENENDVSRTHSHDGAGWINSAIPLKSHRQRLALYTSSPGSFATLLRHTYQPFQALVLFPAVAFAALQYGCILAWLSLVVTLTAEVFPGPPYYYGSDMIGLMGKHPARVQHCGLSFS